MARSPGLSGWLKKLDAPPPFLSEADAAAIARTHLRASAVTAARTLFGFPDDAGKPQGRPSNARLAAVAAAEKVADAKVASPAEPLPAIITRLGYDGLRSAAPDAAATAAPAPAGGGGGTAAAAVGGGGGAAGAPVVIDDDDDTGPTRAYAAGTIAVVHASTAHKWARDGTHMGFYEYESYEVRLRDTLGYNGTYPSRATAYLWLKAEKDAYERGAGLRTRPELRTLLQDVTKTKTLLATIREEPPLVKRGAAYKFKPEWYDELKAKLALVKGEVGFGPWQVATFASQIHMEHEVVDDDDAAWFPSDEWCYWCVSLHRGGGGGLRVGGAGSPGARRGEAGVT